MILKTNVKSLKSGSTRFFATLRDSMQLYAIPKIKNRTHLESRRIESSRLGSPTKEIVKNPRQAYLL